MDLSLITGAVASINAAKEIGKAAIGLRDFNEMATKISAMNAELLRAQDSLFEHNAQLLSLQQELFSARRELDAAKVALAERGNYDLHPISRNGFAYRSKSDPSGQGPEHLICQPCFDGPEKRKVVLLRLQGQNAGPYFVPTSWQCPVCKNTISE